MLLLAALLCTLEDRINFGLEVRPILARRCFACHGPDTDGRQADLALHTSHDAAKVIIQGSPTLLNCFAALSRPIPMNACRRMGLLFPMRKLKFCGAGSNKARTMASIGHGNRLQTPHFPNILVTRLMDFFSAGSMHDNCRLHLEPIARLWPGVSLLT